MSDSSDEGETFRYRNYGDDESDDERPNKRRKTMKEPILRSRGLGFVSATVQHEDEEQEDEDLDDDRPTMGSGTGIGMGNLRSAFNIGEYNDETAERSLSPEASSGAQTPSVAGRGPSAFGAGGRIQKNSFAARMMAKQGYVEGQGLGKSGQGITAPIQTEMLQSRAGLGHGRESERPKKSKQKVENKSRTSTPGTSTPKIRGPPKAKYNVSAIESRGLHVPDAMKSIIVDATGVEAKTVSSLSGFSTPPSEVPQASEAAKASSRIKMQLQAYADAWDTTKEQETQYEMEEKELEAAVSLHTSEAARYHSIISDFERVSMDDSGEARNWEHVIERLQEVQDEFADYIEELDLPELTIACLEVSFRREMNEWDPFTDPAHLIQSFQSIGALLELEKATGQRHRRRTTVFETLLLQHWYPKLRTAFKGWDVYDPEKATTLLNEWMQILPPWLVYKILDEIVLPKLIEAVRRYPKTVELNNALSSGTSSRKRTAPDLHSWLFDWWSLVSDDDLDIEKFAELRHLVKSKVNSESWPVWKPLLGSRRPAPAVQALPPPVQPKSVAIADELTFRDIVDEWCAENDLMLRSSGMSDSLGRLLYRLQDAAMRSKGILIYFQGDVIFDEDGEPYGLDDKLINKASKR